MREQFTAADPARVFGASPWTCCEKKLLPNGGAKALVLRNSRPLRHPDKQWMYADALWGVRHPRGDALARLRLARKARHPDKPQKAIAMYRLICVPSKKNLE